MDVFLEVVRGEFVQGVLAALVLAMLAFLARAVTRIFVQVVSRTREFDIRGTWIGECWLPSYKDHKGLEIWSYARSGDRIRFSFYSYDGPGRRPKKWLGSGIFRNNILSGFYYQAHSQTYESGSITLQIRELRLMGAFSQFDANEVGEPLHISRDYKQARVALTQWQKLRMAVGLSPLLEYEEVRALLNRAFGTPVDASQ